MPQYDMQFTPLLPSQLLMGSPFQSGTPAMGQYATFGGGGPGTPGGSAAFQFDPVLSPTGAQSPNPASHYFQHFYGPPMELDDRSRTVYLGNVPADTTPEELLSHVRSGIVESVKLVPDKTCAFISFLDHASAAHFHSDAVLKNLTVNGHEIKVGWGKSTPLSPTVSLAVTQDGASRNVYLGNLPDDITEDEIREELADKFGPIDTVKLVREKNIGFVHFLNIATAIKCVQRLPYEAGWTDRKVFYGKDRCAYISKTQQQNAAQYLGITPGYEHLLASADREMLSSALFQQSAAAVAVATAAGGAANVGNRTVYLGNIHPETTIEELCNIVRGGLLHNVKYIAEKHICFVTFIDPTAAAQFFALANLHGISIHNRRLKVGWGKHSGPLPNAIALAVTAGASRNVYIGNIDDNWPESKLRHDFAEYGDIEQINFLPEKSCAFVNFTNITNAIKAIEGIKQKDEYRQFKINFGKDRCGNPPRQLQQQMQQMYMGQQQDETRSSEADSEASSEDAEEEEEQEEDDNDTVENGGSETSKSPLSPTESSSASSRPDSSNGANYMDPSKLAAAVNGFGITPHTTPGSHLLMQYLAHAQEQYMYASNAAWTPNGFPRASPTYSSRGSSTTSVVSSPKENGSAETEGETSVESERRRSKRVIIKRVDEHGNVTDEDYRPMPKSAAKPPASSSAKSPGSSGDDTVTSTPTANGTPNPAPNGEESVESATPAPNGEDSVESANSIPDADDSIESA
ncbi:hypothetical protein TRVA0_005S02718 [Trichomonascus vanleenenianus]|uniref:uncharacterized protein n=1 Tax=Trichomonascus vanleenenianus TaxID=2268995 RepID=UPI003ECB7D0B